MADIMKLSVPGKPEYVGTVRMAISCLANNAGFDVEAIEDIKVAVSEACNNAICHGKNNNGIYEVSCELEEGRLVVSVIDQPADMILTDTASQALPYQRKAGWGFLSSKH